MALLNTPVIPEYITVHLGLPDQPAENVRVRFVDYIKNVASSEIYPNWPESAIRANILAQISYALNRVYTEYYRSKGYDFDITSTTQFDQKYIQDRDVFENISQIVDDIFNNYVIKRGTVQPYFTQYCNGTTSTCDGLSQWGTVDLAKRGLTPYEILQEYYGDDIDIVMNAPVANVPQSYPGVPLRLGSVGENVRIIKRQLNRIADNYPAIPRIPDINGYFDQATENAVRKFQSIFNLTVDGVVGKATWYKIKSIYNGIKRLNELYSEGLTPEEVERFYPPELKEGDTDGLVLELQYILAIVAYFDDQIPIPPVNGVFDERTKQTLMAFQRQYGLEPTGVLNQETLNRLIAVYRDTRANVPQNVLPDNSLIYPGRYLLRGSKGDDVTDLQSLLNRAAETHSFVPKVTVDGVFGPDTEAAVRAVQQHEHFDVNGIVGPLLWNRIADLAKNA
ncbi:MAG: peptidoglycan-binding protein [Hominenteromicrobium sp.]